MGYFSRIPNNLYAAGSRAVREIVQYEIGRSPYMVPDAG
jgi:hypothetical protein